MYSQSPNLLPRIVMEIRIQLFVQKIETNSKEETHVSPQCPRKPKKHIKLFFPKLIKKQTKSSLDPWINSYPPRVPNVWRETCQLTGFGCQENMYPSRELQFKNDLLAPKSPENLKETLRRECLQFVGNCHRKH